MAPHWFYIPVALAAARLGIVGAAATALGAGVLAGPLMPADVGRQIPQDLSDWTTRAGFFLLNGAFIALLIRRLRSSLAREVEVAQKERELARHKAEVLQTVSHEFRTPVTVVKGAVETLTVHGLVTEEGRPLLNGLRRAARRIEDLVSMVLAAAEAQHRVREDQRPVSLREIIGDVGTALADFAAADRLRVRFLPGSEVVMGNTDVLSPLLRAVIENALKFSPRESPVEVEASRATGVVEIRVRDHGPGIPEGFAERAFEPLTQFDQSATREHDGLGLGLFAAKRLVEEIAGTIELLAPEDGGTEVVLTIPQRRTEDALLEHRASA